MNTRTIPLSQGYEATIDEADYELVNQNKWCVRGGKKSPLYCQCNMRVNGEWTRVYLHRFLTGAQKGQIVDHRDGNPLNNTRSNLRITTHQGNNTNKARMTIRSLYKGVIPAATKGKWVAQIGAAGKHYYLGTFTTAELAARAYDRMAVKLHGEFAKLNFPEDELGAL